MPWWICLMKSSAVYEPELCCESCPAILVITAVEGLRQEVVYCMWRGVSLRIMRWTKDPLLLRPKACTCLAGLPVHLDDLLLWFMRSAIGSFPTTLLVMGWLMSVNRITELWNSQDVEMGRVGGLTGMFVTGNLLAPEWENHMPSQTVEAIQVYCNLKELIQNAMQL